MKKTNRTVVPILGALFAAAMLAACEDADTGSALVVDPASSDVSGVGATVLLTARMPTSTTGTNRSGQVILPLKWSVSNPRIGGIMSSRGYSAVYESGGQGGQNVIFVEDAYGREGLAVVNQN